MSSNFVLIKSFTIFWCIPEHIAELTKLIDPEFSYFSHIVTWPISVSILNESLGRNSGDKFISSPSHLKSIFKFFNIGSLLIRSYFKTRIEVSTSLSHLELPKTFPKGIKLTSVPVLLDPFSFILGSVLS